MRRRRFLTSTGTALVGASIGLRLPTVHAADHTGKLLIVVQADGGWDPTSFCDPKTNVPGEPVINHWAESAEIQTAGALAYAPFAANQAFFDKYHARMLVINGVDAQTNNHSVGVLHNLTGRVSEGFPSLTALFAAARATPDMSLKYLNNGWRSDTGGLVRPTRVANPQQLLAIANPSAVPWLPDVPMIPDSNWNLIKTYQNEAAEERAGDANLLPQTLRNRDAYRTAMQPSETLASFADLSETVTPEREVQVPGAERPSTLRRQAQIALLAFKAGAAISADLIELGFDTHQRHDAVHEPLLANLTNGVDYIWEIAETLGLADRLIVVLTSDFGRTNFYNASNGKDHWPIGSIIVMEKDQPWAGRAVGLTDPLHNAIPVNPTEPTSADPGGTNIYPKHVHAALRRYLGIDDFEAVRFGFPDAEAFAFFG